MLVSDIFYLSHNVFRIHLYQCILNRDYAGRGLTFFHTIPSLKDPWEIALFKMVREKKKK